MRLLLASWILSVPTAAQDARSLYLLHCASCHGETGDGHGTAALDRPARSFQDGGFSYGNTPEALLRTITHGIPGTPMPAAPSALSEAERKALADHVLSLGPPVETATTAESTLSVRDRPLVVRGKLPAIAEDLPARPRGLLIGMLEGLSFEYRTDDVRLLAVRQGAFADRRDWRGRGGDSLFPLGVPIHLCGRGDPRATFAREDGSPLLARIASTFVDGRGAGLSYRLFGGERPVASVLESVRACDRPAGSGFARSFAIEPVGPEDGGTKLLLRAAEAGPAFFAAGFSWTVRRRSDGSFEAVSVRGLDPGRMLAFRDGAALAEISLRPGERRSIEVETLLLSGFSGDVEERWRAGVVP